MYLAEFKRGDELNFKRFLLFKTLKTIFANRKLLINLNDQEYKVQQENKSTSSMNKLIYFFGRESHN